MCTNTAKRSERWLAKRKHVSPQWDQEYVGDRPPQAGHLTWLTKKMNWPALMTCRLFFTVTTVGSLWTQQTPQKWQELPQSTVIISLRWVKLNAYICADSVFVILSWCSGNVPVLILIHECPPVIILFISSVWSIRKLYYLCLLIHLLNFSYQRTMKQWLMCSLEGISDSMLLWLFGGKTQVS